MAPNVFLSAVTTAVFAASAVVGQNAVKFPLASRDDIPLYLQYVCYPPAAPCVDITSIQQACNPNGTSPLALEAHAQCMCGGSFFAEWDGCLDCLFVHGFRSSNSRNEYLSIIDLVSTELCDDGTPTAPFQALFNNVQATFSPAPAGPKSDQYPSNSAISLYYTATGYQGPGTITGSATLATATPTTPHSTSSHSPPFPTPLVFASAKLVGSGTGVFSKAPSASVTSIPTIASNAASSQEHVGLVAVAAAVAFAAMV